MTSVAGSMEARSSERSKVLYRTRATRADGSTMAVTLVDMSDGGFMARTEAVAAEGDRLSLDLPAVGRVAAEVRWALGGRIGCRLDGTIGPAHYLELLAVIQE